MLCMFVQKYLFYKSKKTRKLNKSLYLRPYACMWWGCVLSVLSLMKQKLLLISVPELGEADDRSDWSWQLRATGQVAGWLCHGQEWNNRTHVQVSNKLEFSLSEILVEFRESKKTLT